MLLQAEQAYGQGIHIVFPPLVKVYDGLSVIFLYAPALVAGPLIFVFN